MLDKKIEMTVLHRMLVITNHNNLEFKLKIAENLTAIKRDPESTDEEIVNVLP